MASGARQNGIPIAGIVFSVVFHCVTATHCISTKRKLFAGVFFFVWLFRWLRTLLATHSRTSTHYSRCNERMWALCYSSVSVSVFARVRLAIVTVVVVTLRVHPYRSISCVCRVLWHDIYFIVSTFAMWLWCWVCHQCMSVWVSVCVLLLHSRRVWWLASN